MTEMSKNKFLAAQTNQKIKETFLKLLTEKPFNKISIKEITYDAGINRCTFYLHFKSIDDLLKTIESDIQKDINAILNNWKGNTPLDYKSIILPIVSYISSRKTHFRCILMNDAGSRFGDKLKDLLRQNITELASQSDREIDNMKIDMLVSAKFGILIDWIINNSPSDDNHFTEILLEYTKYVL